MERARCHPFGAALAYYTVLSLAPLLVVAVAIAGIVFRRETVHTRILEQVTNVMGYAGADAVSAILVRGWDLPGES